MALLQSVLSASLARGPDKLLQSARHQWSQHVAELWAGLISVCIKDHKGTEEHS